MQLRDFNICLMVCIRTFGSLKILTKNVKSNPRFDIEHLRTFLDNHRHRSLRYFCTPNRRKIPFGFCEHKAYKQILIS